MTTKERIEADYLKEYKAKNTPAIEALRMLRSAIKQIEVDERKVLDDAGIVEVVGREMKKLKDSVDNFTTGGRQDLVDKTRDEMRLLATYLPQQMTDEEIKATIAKVIGGMGEVTMKDFGKVMGAVSAETKGKADGGKVNAMVKEAMAGK